MGAALFLASALLAPRRGLIARWMSAKIIDTSMLDLDTATYKA